MVPEKDHSEFCGFLDLNSDLNDLKVPEINLVNQQSDFWSQMGISEFSEVENYVNLEQETRQSDNLSVRDIEFRFEKRAMDQTFIGFNAPTPNGYPSNSAEPLATPNFELPAPSFVPNANLPAEPWVEENVDLSTYLECNQPISQLSLESPRQLLFQSHFDTFDRRNLTEHEEFASVDLQRSEEGNSLENVQISGNGDICGEKMEISGENVEISGFSQNSDDEEVLSEFLDMTSSLGLQPEPEMESVGINAEVLMPPVENTVQPAVNPQLPVIYIDLSHLVKCGFAPVEGPPTHTTGGSPMTKGFPMAPSTSKMDPPIVTIPSVGPAVVLPQKKVLDPVEKYLRRRRLNNESCKKSRQARKERLELMIEEKARLEARNKHLRYEVGRLEKMAEHLRDSMLKMMAGD